MNKRRNAKNLAHFEKLKMIQLKKRKRNRMSPQFPQVLEKNIRRKTPAKNNYKKGEGSADMLNYAYHAFQHFAENNMTSIEPRGLGSGYEELRSISILTSISH